MPRQRKHAYQIEKLNQLENRALMTARIAASVIPETSPWNVRKPIIAVLDGPTGSEHAADVVNVIQRRIYASGLSPGNVTIMQLVVEDPAGRVIPAELIQAVASAKANGATVANLSFRLDSLRPEDWDALAAAAGDLPLVVASGNDGQSSTLAVSLKAKGFNALVVGASDGHGRRSSFSDYGPGIIFAPGQRLRVNDPVFGRGLVSGTSFAAANKSAEMAVIAARHPELSPDQAADRVRRSDATVWGPEEGFSKDSLHRRAAVANTIGGSPGTLAGAKSDQLSWLSHAIGGITNTFKGVFNKLADTLKKIDSGIGDLFQNLIPSKQSIKRVLNALVHGNLLDLLPTVEALGFHISSDNYGEVVNDLARKYGRGNVYVASQDFVRWLGPPTMIRDGLAIGATGGVGLALTIDDVKAHVEQEWPPLRNWLIKRGIDNVRLRLELDRLGLLRG